MESDLGKLFIGGISWDTNEDRLREYFMTYGEVLEAVIMKDRNTGRARGFGFIVFADPAVAERVVMDKHVIDGRTVEAKKAVPRDDQHILNRNNNSLHESPGPARTKKIFVGGLASTVTESDFKKYFEQFGMITDVVVMYDHNTQRPRGFGFITYDSEEAVEKVLLNSFHELNGKMVEVKRAVPKELSPGPMRSPLSGYNNYGFNRINSFLNGYSQGYNPSSIGGYGMRMDARFSPISTRSGLTPFGSSAYGMGMNFETGLNSNYGGSAGFNNSHSYGRAMTPYYGGNSNRFSAPSPIGSLFSSTARNVWGNGLNYGTSSSISNAYTGSGSGGGLGVFSNNGVNWGSSSPPISTPGGGGGSGYGNGWSGDNNYGLGGNGYNRNSGTAPPSYAASSGGYEGSHGDLYNGSSAFGDPTWRSGTPDLDGSGSFGYGLGNTGTDVTAKGSAGYMSGYNASNRQPNRGITT
ncbi:Heterogeneous nuclear ribonucleoprotein 1 [Acorus calamus]|uniref:Heterogeneous nuclear ribonucleoprotein 1 n=1 Tax=Acorus calamus TaxID=4465 RepID=A0AAV9CUE6_ACOCL|nr:Heterogeneous nuclear ribonucleoprotein 1 [Acorus calamus]